MGDLEKDTAVEGGNGHYRATLSRDWEIWGPNGGYIASILLRAGGAHSGLPRPASMTLHFLGAARFEEVELETVTLRAGKRSHSVRVSMRQGDHAIAEALVWTVDHAAAGPEFDWTTMPEVPAPSDLRPLDELLADEGDEGHPFWQNLELRPLEWMSREEWDLKRPQAPHLKAWCRFRPSAVFEDPYVEAARVALLLDTEGWPAATRALSPETNGRWIAPNMDVSISFHAPPAGAEYLLVDMEAPLSKGGLIGAQGRVWSPDGRLLGTGIQQMLFREVTPPAG